MRILIEGGTSVTGKRGITVYMENLIRELARIDKVNEYYLFCHFFRDYRRKSQATFDFFPKQDNFHLRIKRWPERVVRFLEKRLRLPVREWYFKSLGIDIFQSMGFFHLGLKGIINIIACQDAFFEHLEFFPNAPWSREELRDSLRTADWVVAVSRTTYDEIVRIPGVAPEKIAIVSYGIDTNVFRPIPRTELAWVRQKFRLPERFILCVGPFAIKDNVDTLVAAFGRLIETPQYRDHALVLVGPLDSGAPIPLDRMISQSGFPDKVIQTGYVPPQSPEIVGLYNLADALVFISSHESCGLPALEAMACGVPVVASNVSASPEFVGDAGLLADPRSPEAVAEALLELARDPALRARNVERGLERVKRWPWEKSARDLLALWRRAYAAGTKGAGR